MADPNQEAFDPQRVFAEALALHEGGRLPEAQALYTAILDRMPRHPDALNLLGVVAAQRGRLDRARELIEAALAERPEHPEFLFNLAHIRELDGDPAATEGYRRVLEVEPNHLPSLVNLGNALLVDEAHEEAAEIFRRAADADPRSGKAHAALGFALQRLGRIEAALAALERATELDPHDAEAVANLAGLYLELGRPEASIAQTRRALTMLQDNADLHANLGIALYNTGDAVAALEALSTARRLDPRNVRAAGTIGFVRTALGEGEAARTLIDYDRFLQIRRVTSVPGFPSLESFNHALAKHATGHPSLVADRPSKTTRGGQQTGDLGGTAEPAVRALIETIEEVVGAYLERMSGLTDDPYFSVPSRWRLSLWATILDAGGHQVPHNHPAGLLGGVYYVKVPEALGGEAGAIEFGRPPAHFRTGAPPKVKLVHPAEGMLILFPSYFWHRTIPFDGAEQRISIAFDVIPEE